MVIQAAVIVRDENGDPVIMTCTEDRFIVEDLVGHVLDKVNMWARIFHANDDFVRRDRAMAVRRQIQHDCSAVGLSPHRSRV